MCFFISFSEWLGNVGALSPDGIPEMELKRWSEIHRFEMVKVMFRAC